MGIVQLTTATSGTVTPTDTQQDLTLAHDAGVTAALTIPFPANPITGQVFCVTSVSGIAALTMTSGSTIVGALTSLLASGNGTWQYINSKWMRIK